MLLSSCATGPLKPVGVSPQQPAFVFRQDIYHTVGPGETVWRISKMYDVNIKEVMRANNITSPQDLKMGQRLVIPNAAPLRPVIPLYRSDKWKYIIIHHSATDVGNALDFNKLHNRKGWQGLGYHFVIDNGSKDKKEGQIEASPRWIKQLNGAHCNASQMNYKGIGICLVGNFSQDRVGEKQMESLVYLVNTLRKYYNIPTSRIIGHGQVPGARTECPGKYFPWHEFYSKLKSSY